MLENARQLMPVRIAQIGNIKIGAVRGSCPWRAFILPSRKEACGMKRLTRSALSARNANMVPFPAVAGCRLKGGQIQKLNSDYTSEAMIQGSQNLFCKVISPPTRDVKTSSFRTYAKICSAKGRRSGLIISVR